MSQDRKRIYIVGTKSEASCLDGFEKKEASLESVLEQGLPTSESLFIKMLLSKFAVDELHGKSLKDKRGGADNVHSWDIGMKGPVTEQEKELLNQMLTERRKKKWAEIYGIDWMDGMTLTKKVISSFNNSPNLQDMLSDFVRKGYDRT